MTAPLDGIRVIEFANFAAAPSATAIMADLGAEVIKVEPPTGDPWRRTGMKYNRDDTQVMRDAETALVPAF